MRELSIFIDESGSDDLRERYYLVAFVFHEQDIPIAEGIEKYERAVAENGLPLLPFHASPLMNGKDQFKDLGISERKKAVLTIPSYVSTFAHLVQGVCIQDASVPNS